jgi:hypothetical protein
VFILLVHPSYARGDDVPGPSALSRILMTPPGVGRDKRELGRCSSQNRLSPALQDCPRKSGAISVCVNCRYPTAAREGSIHRGTGSRWPCCRPESLRLVVAYALLPSNTGYRNAFREYFVGGIRFVVADSILASSPGLSPGADATCLPSRRRHAVGVHLY